MSQPIPFRGKEDAAAADALDDATEVTLDDATPATSSRVTRRLSDDVSMNAGLSDVFLSPLNILPPTTQAHVRAAGREAALTITSLTATVLKGTAIVLNIAGEALRDYTERNSNVIDLRSARQARQRVDIEVE